MKLNKSKIFTVMLPLLLFPALFVLSPAQPLSPSPPPPLQPSPSPPSVGCTSILVSFSPCLPYVASLPNNVSATVSSPCCDVFWPLFQSGDSNCLCYLFRQPHLLGFPLDRSRIRSLASVCHARNGTAAINSSIELLCLASPTLPPLRSVTPAIALPNSTDSSQLNESTGYANSPPSVMSSPSEPMDSTPSLPNMKSEPGSDLYGSQQVNITITSTASNSFRFLPRIMTSLVVPLAVSINAKLKYLL